MGVSQPDLPSREPAVGVLSWWQLLHFSNLQVLNLHFPWVPHSQPRSMARPVELGFFCLTWDSSIGNVFVDSPLSWMRLSENCTGIQGSSQFKLLPSLSPFSSVQASSLPPPAPFIHPSPSLHPTKELNPSLAWQADSLPLSHLGSHIYIYMCVCVCVCIHTNTNFLMLANTHSFTLHPPINLLHN